jgi:hydroxymethylbilane synthase
VAERVRIGTRGSPLALRQAEQVAEGLRRAWRGLAVELVAIRTSADRMPEAHLAQVGGKGLFVKEIDEALLEGRVDVAVHSLKDVPGAVPHGLALAAFPPREDPRDVLVSGGASGIPGLARGARVGTGSPRRRAQLLAHRPDLRVAPIRGNVETRLRKLDGGVCDAVVLAAAGLARLGLAPAGAAVLEPEEMLPAIGQGALAVETRADDREARERVAAVDDAPTRTAALAERAFLVRIGGSCTTPLAGLARFEAGQLRLDVFVATPDGTATLRDAARGDARDPEALGAVLAERMLARGAAALMAEGSTGGPGP